MITVSILNYEGNIWLFSPRVYARKWLTFLYNPVCPISLGQLQLKNANKLQVTYFTV